MKTIELSNDFSIWNLMEWAEKENILIRGKNGREFLLAAIDDFEAEVESLRNNEDFIAFLDERAKQSKIPIEEARRILLE
jgi:hypothetical protein